jgi:hypothetical protein
MTTLAPPVAPAGQKTATASGGRSGPVAWMALPALIEAGGTPASSST